MSDDVNRPRQVRSRRSRRNNDGRDMAKHSPETRGPEVYTETLNVPGLPCPECGNRIIIEPAALLAGAPIQCSSCGLTLTVNAERSIPALNALSHYLASFEQAKARFKQTTEQMPADSDTPMEKPRGNGRRRVAGRRQRRRR